jgi:hypothetical protein
MSRSGRASSWPQPAELHTDRLGAPADGSGVPEEAHRACAQWVGRSRARRRARGRSSRAPTVGSLRPCVFFPGRLGPTTDAEVDGLRRDGHSLPREPFVSPKGWAIGEPIAPGTPVTRTSARPRKDSNLRTRFRKPTLYPLSYGGQVAKAVPPPPPRLLAVTSGGPGPWPHFRNDAEQNFPRFDDLMDVCDGERGKARSRAARAARHCPACGTCPAR